MNSSTIFSLFLGFILVSQSPITTNAGRHIGKGRALVLVFCAASPDKVECNKILSSPQILQCKNYEQFSKAVVEIAHKKAAEGQAFLKGIAQKANSPALTLCAGSAYDSTVRDFKGCLAEITVDHISASYDCAVAVDGLAQCERALAKEHIVNPAITALNSQIGFLCQLASRALVKPEFWIINPKMRNL